MSDQKLTVSEPRVASVEITSGGVVQLRSLDDTWRLAKAIYASGLAPTSFKNEQAILVAILMGCELGLGPMQAIQSIAVINGRPSIYGDTALALVRQSGLLENYAQEFSGEGESKVAIVKIKRKGESPQEFRFSVADAKRAQLWGKNVWAQYPDRMLMFRARGFALRDCFGDVLRGFRTSEEAQDIPPEDNHEQRLAQAVAARVVPEVSSEAAPNRPRNRSPKEVDNPFGESESDTQKSLAKLVEKRLLEEGETVERFLSVLHQVKMSPEAKTIEEVSAQDLQTALDDWENVRTYFSQVPNPSPDK